MSTALEEFPRELSVSTRQTRKGTRWMLWISGPGVSGQVVSSSQAVVLGVAEAYAGWRREQAGGSP